MELHLLQSQAHVSGSGEGCRPNVFVFEKTSMIKKLVLQTETPTDSHTLVLKLFLNDAL